MRLGRLLIRMFFSALILFCLACNSQQAQKTGSADSSSAQLEQSRPPEPIAPSTGSSTSRAQEPPSISYATNPERFAKMPVYEQPFNIKNPKTAQEHFNVAVNHDHHNEFADAIAEYKKALEIQPNWPVAHYRMALDYQKQGHLDEAIAEWEQTTHYDPQFYSAYDMLAGTYQRQGNLKKAIEALAELLKYPPSRMPVHYQLGLWYEEVGDRPHALMHWEAYRDLALKAGDESKTDRFQKALGELQKLKAQN